MKVRRSAGGNAVRALALIVAPEGVVEKAGWATDVMELLGSMITTAV